MGISWLRKEISVSSAPVIFWVFFNISSETAVSTLDGIGRALLDGNWEISISKNSVSFSTLLNIDFDTKSLILDRRPGSLTGEAKTPIGEKSVAQAISYVRKAITTVIATTFIHFLSCQSNIGIAPFKKNSRVAEFFLSFSLRQLGYPCQDPWFCAP